MKVRKINSEKGVTLTVLIIMVIILIIIASTLIYNSSNNVKIKALKQLFNDIELLNNKIQLYYLDKKELPTIAAYTNVTAITNKNPNDAENEYYVIDLKKIEGIHLNYGREYEDVKKFPERANNYKDIYIINKKSHTIYYPKGIEIDGTIYYQQNETYTKVQE